MLSISTMYSPHPVHDDLEMHLLFFEYLRMRLSLVGVAVLFRPNTLLEIHVEVP